MSCCRCNRLTCELFVPTLDAEQLIETYAVLGGMPRNLLALDPQRSLMRNIEREVLDPAGSLFSEVRLLLHEKLKGEVDAFSRVLEAIAAGNHQRQEIAAAANGRWRQLSTISTIS